MLLTARFTTFLEAGQHDLLFDQLLQRLGLQAVPHSLVHRPVAQHTLHILIHLRQRRCPTPSTVAATRSGAASDPRGARHVLGPHPRADERGHAYGKHRRPDATEVSSRESCAERSWQVNILQFVRHAVTDDQ